MRTYADAYRCPDCGAARVPGPRCGDCGLLLQGPLADQLWGLLTATDATLAQLRAERAAQAPVEPVDSVRPAQPAQPAPLPAVPPSATLGVPAAGPRRHVSVAAVLLALGALLVVVAAFVFVAVTWGELSLATRALVLVAITGAAALAATLISRRGLRASAEAAWAVTLAMLALDIAAARGAGLAGLGTVSTTAFLVGAGTVLALVGSGVAAAVRRTPTVVLVVPQLVSLCGLAVAGYAAMDAWNAPLAWRLLVAAGVAAVATLVHRALDVTLVAVSAAVATVVLAVGHVLVAWLAVIDAATWRAAWMDGRAWPSVVSVLLLLAAGWAASRLPAEGRNDSGPVLVSSAAFAAAGIALTWLFVPLLTDTDALRVAVVLMGAAGVLTLGCVPASGAWGRGVRAWAVLVGLASWLGCVDDLIALGGSLTLTPLPAWQQPFGVRLDGLDVAGLPWWTAALQLLVAAGGLLIAALLWRLGPGRVATRLRHVGPAVAAILIAVACLLPIVALQAPVAALSGVTLALGAAAALPGLAGRLGSGQAPVAGVLLGSASYEALAAPELSALIWALVALVLVAASIGLSRVGAPRSQRLTAVTTTLAGGFGVASLLAVSEALDLSPRTRVLLVAAAALALMALASFVRRRPGLRTGSELAAVTAAVLAATGASVVAVDDGPAFLALVLTLLGAGTAMLAVLVPDRRRLAPVAGAVLAVAWWLRLAASDVATVEAYTLPVAMLLLLAGLWVMLGRPGTSSIKALLPGLLLSTAPSLPAALAAPSSLRGLLLGLSALVLVGLGARLSWAAPFGVGVVVSVLLAGRHLGPYADALPRWVLLAAAGLLLLVAGTTWENRAREARRGLAAVRAMH